MILTKTWLKDDVLSSELFPPCFSVFRADRTKCRGGGVLLAASGLCPVRDLELQSSIASSDILGVTISLGDHYLIVVAVYIEPSCDVNDYIAVFDYIENYIDFSHPVLIVGDFNIPELVECINGVKAPTNVFNAYANFLALDDLSQLNNIVNANNRLLDLILTANGADIEVKRGTPLVREDTHHPCLNFTWRKTKSSNVPFPSNGQTPKFNFHKVNLVGLYVTVSELDWANVLNSHETDTACECFYTPCLTQCRNMHQLPHIQIIANIFRYGLLNL